MEANPFCPKRQNPWRNQRKSLGVGAKLPVEFHLGIPKCLRQSWEKMLLSRLGMGFFGSTGISKLVSRRGKKMIVSPARNTTFFILNWPTQYKMILSKCLPKMKNVKKTKKTGFSAFHLENEIKKDVDSCRAASQSIPLFSMTSDAKKTQKTSVKIWCQTWHARRPKSGEMVGRAPHGMKNWMTKRMISHGCWVENYETCPIFHHISWYLAQRHHLQTEYTSIHP